MFHAPAPIIDDQIIATPGPVRAIRSVTLARRTLTVLPAHDGIVMTCDKTDEITAIEIRAALDLSPDDLTDLLRRGIVSADAGHGTLPLRIAVPKPLWRNIPCAREPLRIQISLEAVSANGTITLHARAHRLFPADGAGAWAA